MQVNSIVPTVLLWSFTYSHLLFVQKQNQQTKPLPCFPLPVNALADTSIVKTLHGA